jgi:hypothetical protein
METNKLIAEFMGRSGKLCDTLYTFKGVSDLLEDDIWYTIEQSKFHTSWDWLIPVVIKIEQDCEGIPQELLNISLYSDINEVYNAVVEFIKEYNKQN